VLFRFSFPSNTNQSRYYFSGREQKSKIEILKLNLKFPVEHTFKKIKIKIKIG
jgi:hypothetical protein